MTEFCPDLQLPWTFKSLQALSLDKLQIKVGFSLKEAGPHPMGRHVSDISSYPQIWVEWIEVEFAFSEIVWFEIRDDRSASLAIDDCSNGKTFWRFIDSRLLALQRPNWPEVPALPLYHYRLVCADRLIDVVTRTIPVIVKRTFRDCDIQSVG